MGASGEGEFFIVYSDNVISPERIEFELTEFNDDKITFEVRYTTEDN